MSTTELSATEIARLVADGEVSNRRVVDEHIERIETVNGSLNAVVVRLFDDARRRADAADEARARGAVGGPLAGVPMTVKESFDLAGVPTTAGVAALTARVPASDSAVVQRLRGSGAIILGKTNVAQALLYHESDNPLFGRTNNPWDLERSPGGSSGGEAAIIAAGGSALGLASDLGGSIRVPAHFCGIHGLKPTSGLLPLDGSFEERMFPGQLAIRSEPGLLARSVDDLALGLRALTGPGHPVAIRDGAERSSHTLRIGYYADDGLFQPAPAVRRAVEEASRALADRGAIVEPFQPPDADQLHHLYFGLLSADAGRWLRRLLRGGAIDPRVRGLLRVAGLPRAARALVVPIVRALGQADLALLLESAGQRSGAPYWELVEGCGRFRGRFAASLKESRIDAILCPPHPLPAISHGASYRLGLGGTYSFAFNLLGMPAGVVSTTRVRPGEESERAGIGDRSSSTAMACERGSAGLPVGVQITGRHGQDDVVLAQMRELEEHFAGPFQFPLKDRPSDNKKEVISRISNGLV